ncbi:MAG: hypothetical protein FWD90_02490 [Defluviitaleaceae bacterium]|nr:hypothetical protein [Defluviitaleaceae bacterium]
MMYPFIQLEDETEIVHSEILRDNRVKVYIEKPIYGGFNSATCYLPSYEWSEVTGFLDSEIEKFQEILESTAYLIIIEVQHGR